MWIITLHYMQRDAHGYSSRVTEVDSIPALVVFIEGLYAPDIKSLLIERVVK